MAIFKKTTNAEIDGIDCTSLVGTFNASYAILREIFGTSLRGDGGKVSTQWIFKNTQDPTSTIVTIYDYKETNLYERGLPSVRAFRTRSSYDWHVGAKSVEDGENFIRWVNRQHNQNFVFVKFQLCCR